MILLYHKIAPNVPTIWWVSVDAFDRQMADLQAYDVVHLDDYDAANPRHAVITFDGVYENVYRYALPILKKWGYPFELFVIGAHIGGDNSFDSIEPLTQFASLNQLEEMSRNGGRVQWHTATHQRLDGLSEAELQQELNVPADLSSPLGPSNFRWLAYPHGDHSEQTVAAVKARFDGALSCEAGNDLDRYQLNRITVLEETRLTQSSVAVIIPNYNYRNFVAEAIESVLAQTMPPDEILVIDDCSIDGSEEIIQRYAHRVRFVRNDHNLGIVENFKRAVQLTTSTYIAFLGADNRMRSDYVERCKAVLDKLTDVGVVYTDMLVFGSRAKLLADSIGIAQVGECIVERSPIYLWRFPEPTNEVLGNFEKLNFIHGSSMYRRQSYDEVGGYRATNAPEDHDLFKRMLQHGWLAKRCPHPLIEYRQHSASQDNTVLNIQLELNYWRGLASDRETQTLALNETLANKELRINELVNALDERDAVIANLQKNVAAVVTTKEKELEDRDAVIATLKTKVAAVEDAPTDLQLMVAAKEKDLEALRQAVNAKDNYIEGLHLAISAYDHSLSWRVTAPLRLIGRLVRRILGLRGFHWTLNSNSGQESLRSMRKTLRLKLLGHGRTLYRRWFKRFRLARLFKDKILRRYIAPEDIQLAALLQPGGGIARSEDETSIEANPSNVPGFHWSPPLNLGVSYKLSVTPHINVLLPSLRIRHMSGGPNTALLFAAHLAEAGEFVRLIATDAPIEGEEAALFPHLDGLFGRAVARDRITLIDGFARSKTIIIGAHDLFFATAWWTAQIAKYAVRSTIYEEFIYLIQDFEPILHEGSTFQALALETYGLPHIPVVNSKLLLDHLTKEGCGSYAQSKFAHSALFFEPAIDRSHYFPDPPKERTETRKRVLLFYARPTVAKRNLFEIGIVALRNTVAAGYIDSSNWEVWAIGEKLDPVDLGRGVTLNPLPWMAFDAYAERIRSADLLLSLMLSPHPSYPPLEMAASGKLVVTNSFSVKTAARMQALSPNIFVALPTAESVADALKSAVGRINARLPSPDPSGALNLPRNWDESLSKVIPELKARIDTLRKNISVKAKVISEGYPTKPTTNYERFRQRRLMQRRGDGQYFQETGLLSFVTCAYDTPSVFLEELAGSLFLQDGGTNFQWLILDNGSTQEATRATLQTIARHPCVTLKRVEKNLGIIGGMRFCLEHATGRYILPLDSDDLLEPDCVHVLTRTLQDADYPALVYTDEDKLADDRFGTAYFKTDWDPVLFIHSCYIAHLCAMDRETALALQCYSDKRAEGCHDWDSFIRFMVAGYIPHHVPEVLYSWRIHPQSTSGNIASKSYISSSHRATLQKFLDYAQAPYVQLVESPLFKYGVDWWFRRKRDNPLRYLSVVIGETPHTLVDTLANEEILYLNPAEGVNGLTHILAQAKSDLVHFRWSKVKPVNDEWFWEAMALSELFSDVVMLGGTLHDGNKVKSAALVFGFGSGYDCPDRDRLVSDPGYFAQMWKPHSVSAVSSGHCVVRHDFLLSVLPQLRREHVSLDMLGPWLGALAREAGKRVVFSPFISAVADSVPEDSISAESRAHFISRFWHLLPEETFFSPRLGLNAQSAYAVVNETEREQHLKRLKEKRLAYPDWFNRHVVRRGVQYPAPQKAATISLLTTIYEQTDIALLDALADSVINQSLRAHQWIIVAHGPISEDVRRYVRDKSATVWGAILVVEPQPLGIMGAMRRALDVATGHYIAPVDADDLLTLDALQILAHEVQRLNEPDLIYSDEDFLVDGQPANPYFRGSFDPVLNLDSSYIWHLCAIKRDTVLKLELYTDVAATWCHDWDSVIRIANAGGRIEHVPEILYHWRRHAGSTTNKPEGDPRSLGSVRHVLQNQIRRTSYPARYTVEPWPINRGAKELYIARHEVQLPRFVWIGDVSSAQTYNQENEDIVLVATVGGITIENNKVFCEVARLLELHPSVAAVGGRVVDANGWIIDGCWVRNRSGKVESPWVGQHMSEPGPYSLALKPQSVCSTGSTLAFLRLSALKALGILPPTNPLGMSSWILSACAQLINANLRIAYTPLVCGQASSALKLERGNPHFFHTAHANEPRHCIARTNPNQPVFARAAGIINLN